MTVSDAQLAEWIDKARDPSVREMLIQLGEDRRAPSGLICRTCRQSPTDHPEIRHESADEGQVCLWPCSHEVQEGEPRCIACQPYTADELDEMRHPF